MSQKRNENPYDLARWRLPVIGGGSIVFGPKNDGISLDVVTGVFKSPVCASAIECDWCSVLEFRSI